MPGVLLLPLRLDQIINFFPAIKKKKKSYHSLKLQPPLLFINSNRCFQDTQLTYVKQYVKYEVMLCKPKCLRCQNFHSSHTVRSISTSIRKQTGYIKLTDNVCLMSAYRHGKASRLPKNLHLNAVGILPQGSRIARNDGWSCSLLARKSRWQLCSEAHALLSRSQLLTISLCQLRYVGQCCWEMKL